MTTETQRQTERRTFIGGSDIAAILGFSRYRTAVDVWAEKTGALAPEDISKKLPIRLGHKLEPVIAELFEEETGFKVKRAAESFTHKKFPHFKAQVDRLVIGEDALLECKSAGEFKAKEWEGDDVPQEYVLQCLWQLAVTGKDLCYIACLIGGNRDFFYKRIERDDEMIANIEKQAAEFWDRYVLPKKMPPASAGDSATLYKLFPKGDESVIVLPEYESRMSLYKSLGKDIDELEEKRDRIANEIRQAIGEASEATAGSYRATWKNQSTGVRLDLERIKKEDPTIYDRFGKEGSARVLRVSEIKVKKGAK
jgi:putative phage-type endonuclease